MTQQLKRSCCQTDKPHEQRRGVTNTGRQSHTQQSKTKMNLQTDGERSRAVPTQRRATVGKLINIFSAKSGGFCRIVNSHTDSCVRSSPSFTHSNVSRCGGTHIPNSNAAPARTPDPRRGDRPNTTKKIPKHTILHFKGHSGSFHLPYYSRG